MACYTPDADSLRKAGYRLTPQRMMVLEALYHYPGYASADQIWERVRATAPQVELSTIYRSLHFLKEQGLVSELLSTAGSAQYAAVREEPHAHAVCMRCGQIFNVPGEWLAQLVDKLAAERQFQSNIPNLEIPGVCERCA